MKKAMLITDLLNGISYNNIIEICEVSYIASKTSKLHYVVILKDATLLCTCTESLQDSQGLSIQDNPQPLSVLPDISNPEYHKPKG
ncbi:hypothetical protein RhiirA1_538548 [Rhizophagus irregularis]|uniref:Uncharacterized protein n=1 Tax=Rhizophagus irregularis TaxID=588596 RepID=A0A2N0RGD5_9GLOM|nr:hypothetical protein RhiirA1_538548 [Rhizophagus irregularis]